MGVITTHTSQDTRIPVRKKGLCLLNILETLRTCLARLLTWLLSPRMKNPPFGSKHLHLHPNALPIISKSRPEFHHLQELLVSLFHCLISLSFHLVLAPGGCFDAFWWVFWFFFMKTRSQRLWQLFLSVNSETLYYFYFSLLLLAMLHGLQDLSSLSRNRTSALCSGMEP